MAFFSKSLRNWTKKHDFIEGLTEWSPTEYAELTEFITEYSPTEYAEYINLLLSFFPQNTQNSQNLLLSILPQISDAILGGALVSSAPTKQTVILPQISQKYTDC